MSLSVQTVAPCLVSHWMMVSQTTHALVHFDLQKTWISLSYHDCFWKSKCQYFFGLHLHSDDSDSVSQRPRSRSVQGSPQLSPMQSLGAEYDVERQGSPRENHRNKNHSRWGNRHPEAIYLLFPWSLVWSETCSTTFYFIEKLNCFCNDIMFWQSV